MDKFPDDLDLKSCNDKLIENQFELSRVVRKNFYDNIKKSINDCERSVQLKFPDKLWIEHRNEIIKELLERFGKLKLSTVGSAHTVLKMVNNKEDIPQNVNIIIIEFIRDN